MPERMIGTAGWSIPARLAHRFPGPGSHLERYARQLPAVEINSSFYRPHRPDTYRRWSESVPAAFRFAVKVPKAITHLRRLDAPEEPLDRFLGEVASLGDKLGPLLVQLPPSLAFDGDRASTFFRCLRDRSTADIVCEPRHRSWFGEEAEALLRAFRVARVAADPAILPAAAEPSGWPGLAYVRLHGSPRTYYSPYPAEWLAELEARLRRSAVPVWCIFDNTAEGWATEHALQLRSGLDEG